MEEIITKSRFKPRALEYFRHVEKTGKELVITDYGRPVIKIIPYKPDPDEALRELRGSVLEYRDPTEPVGEKDWQVLE